MEYGREYLTSKKLLSTSNKKISKDETVTIFGLSLLPHELGGGHNLCPHASEACKAVCLVYSGNARFTNTNIGRAKKTEFYLKDREMFVSVLKCELNKANLLGKYDKVAVRLNMFSDIPWEKQIDMSRYHYLTFYDYTKNPKRMMKFLSGNFPRNYHLTFSYSGTNWSDCQKVLDRGGNVTIVFKGKKLPESYAGYKVINGDESDYRPNDEKGCIVGLKYKQPIANADAKKKELATTFYVEL